jgi:tRNA-dihydrouridine synthase B
MKIIPAPLAGYTDFGFRRILTDCGASEVWTEMISATALYMNNIKTIKMLKPVPNVYNVVQLFGNNPEHFRSVINSNILADFDEININMGCPAPKITKNGSGCKLMTDFEKAKEIISACKSHNKHSKPLSVKMRLGWDKNIAYEFAKICEQAGADRLIVHGRLGKAGYSGAADYKAIAGVVSAVKIPVIANGDIKDEETAADCLKITNASGIMIGRALMGAPWKITFAHPTAKQMKEIIKRHLLLHDGTFNELKKHLLFYCNSLNTGKEIKRRIAAAKSLDKVKVLLDI